MLRLLSFVLLVCMAVDSFGACGGRLGRRGSDCGYAGSAAGCGDNGSDGFYAGNSGCAGGTMYSGFSWGTQQQQQGSCGGDSNSMYYGTPQRAFQNNLQETQQPMPTIQTEPPTTAPVPSRSSGKWRVKLGEPIVSTVWIRIYDNDKLQWAPIVNGYMPQVKYDEIGVIYNFDMRIKYTDYHYRQYTTNGFVNYGQRADVEGIYAQQKKSNIIPASMAK